MKDFRTKVSFEKAFKMAVPNFDETKIWFTHPSKSYEKSYVNFVLDGKLVKLPMYKSEYYIDLWKNYFIEFLETGKFDYNSYWKLYENKDIDPKDVDKVYKFPMKASKYDQFDVDSEELHSFLSDYRKRYKNCGIKQISKPEIIYAKS